MNRIYFLQSLFFFGILTNQISAQNDSSQIVKNTEDSPVRLGIYVDYIGNIDYENYTYSTVLYIWNNTINEFIDLENGLDILNTLEKEILYSEIDSTTLDGNWYYSHLMKVKCLIHNKFDLNVYPFDRNVINIELELISHFAGERDVYIDYENSKLVPDIIKDWEVYDTEFFITQDSYDSNFGDYYSSNEDGTKDLFNMPNQKDVPSFDVINAKLYLKRDSWGIFFKLFFVLFLSLIMASSSIFLPNSKSEEKIEIVIGALFASIGNKYITDSIIPIVNSFVLSDILHLLTIFSLLALVLFAIYEQRRNLPDSIKNDAILFTSVNVFYFVSVGAAVYFNH